MVMLIMSMDMNSLQVFGIWLGQPAGGYCMQGWKGNGMERACLVLCYFLLTVVEGLGSMREYLIPDGFGVYVEEYGGVHYGEKGEGSRIGYIGNGEQSIDVFRECQTNKLGCC